LWGRGKAYHSGAVLTTLYFLSNLRMGAIS
jgi:hypothetical protein